MVHAPSHAPSHAPYHAKQARPMCEHQCFVGHTNSLRCLSAVAEPGGDGAVRGAEVEPYPLGVFLLLGAIVSFPK